MTNEEAFQIYHMYHHIPGWLNIAETLGVSQDTLRVLENYNEAFIAIGKYEEKFDLQAFRDEWIGEFPEARQDLLQSQIILVQQQIFELEKSYEESRANDEPFVNRAILSSVLDDLRKQKRKLEIETVKPSGFFQDFQQKFDRAKARKIEEFLEMKKGKAICPFHDDHDPSFSIWNGKGRCFGCGWSGDVIDFIQKKRGISFKEAVNFLQ